MLRRTLVGLTASSLAAVTLIACQDAGAPTGPTLRDVVLRSSLGSAEQVDQQNLTSNNWAGRGANGFGQSFTAGKTGQLTAIEVEVMCGESMPNAELHLYAGSYNTTTAPPNFAALIASQPVSSSVWPVCGMPQWDTPTRKWIKVAFDTPASVVAGAAYTYRLIYPSGTIYHGVSSFADQYLGGVEWTFHRDWDQIFKTYVVVPDQTPPVITPTVTGPSVADWYVSDVNVSWTVTDGESDVTERSGCGSVQLRDETSGTTLTCRATSAGGSAEQSVTIRIDRSGPALQPVVSPSTVVLNGTATVTPNVSNEGVPLASVTCGDVNTSMVGLTTVICSAYDLAGRGSAVHAPYTVVYPFTGFFAPVDAAPTLNATKAGSAIPVKFSLGGNRGLAILAADSPTSQTISCATSSTTADLEETVTAGHSSLAYDASSTRYTYIWKTEKAWAGTCRKLTVKLNDGAEHTALFKFTK